MTLRSSVYLFALMFAIAGTSANHRCLAAGSNPAGVLQPFVDSHTLAGSFVVMVATKGQSARRGIGGLCRHCGAAANAARLLVLDCFTVKNFMTAAAMMMLVDEGKVKLDDLVENYLPEFAGQMVVVERDKEHVLLRKPKHSITIRNLLSHTSGLPFSTPIEKPDALSFRSPAECGVTP